MILHKAKASAISIKYEKKETIKNVSYRHCITWIFSVHKLDFDCDVSGRTLTIGKIKTLRVNVEKISVKPKSVKLY